NDWAKLLESGPGSPEATSRDARPEETLRRVLEANRRVLGERHPSTLTAMANLAACLGRRDPAAARNLAERAVAGAREVIGGEHPDLPKMMSILADVLEEQGERASAAG